MSKLAGVKERKKPVVVDEPNEKVEQEQPFDEATMDEVRRRQEDIRRTRIRDIVRGPLAVLARLDVPKNLDPYRLSVEQAEDLRDIVKVMSEATFDSSQIEAMEASEEAVRVAGEKAALAYESLEAPTGLQEDLPSVIGGLARHLGRKLKPSETTKVLELARGAEPLTVDRIQRELQLSPVTPFSPGASVRIDPAALSEGDEARLSALLELMADLPAGTIAETRLRKQAQEMVGEILRDIEAGPVKVRPRLEQPGWLHLPPQFLADLDWIDLAEDDPNVHFKYRLKFDDLAVMAGVGFAIESRSVNGSSRLVGDTIHCPTLGKFWNPTRQLGGMTMSDVAAALDRLHRARWLEVSKKTGTPWTIAYGPKMKKALKERG